MLGRLNRTDFDTRGARRASQMRADLRGSQSVLRGLGDTSIHPALMAAFTAGQIVIADWRDALPKEPNKQRPAVVVEDTELFAPAYPNVILVPLTEDAALAIAELSVVIDPTAENGCPKRCFALAHAVATTSVARVKPTASRIRPDQLADIRQKIGAAIGLDP